MEESSSSSSSNGGLVEIREEDMVSPLEGVDPNPFRRNAHFLKPSLKPFKTPPRDFLPKTLFSSEPETFPLKAATFNGWLNPTEAWKAWEARLRPKFAHIWGSAGIDEAIRASTYEIQRSERLILGLSQKWHSETNTFVFSWGEATITLEDTMACGGFSVVGSPVFAPLEEDDEESKELEVRLNEERRKLIKTRAKKASHNPWLKHFFVEETGGEEELEHAAFLSLWLSRFVFPGTISKGILRIAILLARGTRIALAPAVLASIYRDLRLLKSSIDDAMKLGGSRNGDGYGMSPIILRAPFKLVQLWAFERFPTLHPPPNMIEFNQPRIAKWHKVRIHHHHHHENDYVTFSGQSFNWRPYVNSPKSYNEKDGWVCFSCGAHNKEYLESFALCLRHSELVGVELDSHFVEKYLPHRVGMQFGLDQDIPGRVDFCNEDFEIAWRNYNRPVTDSMLVDAAVASSSFLEPGVTCRYLEWWNRSKLGWEEKPGKNYEARSLGHSDHRSDGNEETNNVHPLPVSAYDDKTGVSMVGIGVENLVESENVNVATRGLKRGIEFSDLETRIGKLERIISKLKAEKFGAKAGLS